MARAKAQLMTKLQPLDVDLNGKVALVTGATTGIGKEIARGLARMGAEVVIGARAIERGEAARLEIMRETGNPRISVLRVDVSDMVSVRSFAAEVRAHHRALHILVNNAGAWTTDRRETRQGRELTFATNVMGPYLLTELVADLLRESAPARVVNVASAFASDYDATDLEFSRRKYDGFKAYKQSKLALRMVTWAFAARLERYGVSVNAVAPGFVRTEMNRDARGLLAVMINLSAKVMASSPAAGADTPLWAAVAPELAGLTARYFEKRSEKDGKFRDPSAIAELDRILSEMTAITAGRAAGSRTTPIVAPMLAR